MGTITVRVFDTAVLRWRWPEWPALSRQAKYQLLCGERDRVSGATQQTTNVTCIDLHEWLAQAVNPETGVSDSISTLRVGNGSTSISSSDTALNNHMVTLDLADAIYDAGATASQFDFFMDSGTATGETLTELGLESDSGRFCNHAPIDPEVDKSGGKTVIFEVNLSFS